MVKRVFPCLFGVFLGFASAGAHAQEFDFETGRAPDSLRGTLRTASLTLSLRSDADATAQDLVAAARADYRRLLTALYANGYYAPEISIRINGVEASSIAPLDAPSQIARVEIDVDQGPLFRFGKAQIGPLPEGTTPHEDFAPGERAKSDLIRTATQQAITSWRALGYAKAEVSNQSLRANHAGKTLDASIQIAPGPILSFGDVDVQGAEDVRSEAIRRIAGIPEGEVYSPQALEAAKARLRRTGAFDTANASEAENIAAGATLPITLTVSESKPRRFGFGLELSTINGLTVSSFWMHRNAFGGAERFRVDGEVSGIGGETGGVDYTINASLGVPAIYGPDTDFRATFGISHEEEPTYTIDRVSTEASVTRFIGDDLIGNIGVGVLRAREETADGTRQYTLLTLPAGIEWDKRDSKTNTKQGYYLDLDVTPFLGLENIDNGVRVFADARVYQSFGEMQQTTLAARAMLGSLAGAAPNDAPADFLFFSGGGGSVRGQQYKTLGVVDNGELRGGSSFAGAQLETRYSVTPALSLVGFYDIGHVGDTSTPLEGGDWHAGTGFGVRYNTGIGPIRLDIGTPANGDDAFGSVQVYIGIGQAF